MARGNPHQVQELMALAGETDPEIDEAVTISAALRAGAAITHGDHAFREA